MHTVILASQSPRRKELLEKMGVAFKVIPSTFEEHLDHTRPVEDVALELALGKARNVAADFPDAVTIGADTIVYIDGKQLGKPAGMDEARQVLALLAAGREHAVVTGLAVVHKQSGTELTKATATTVFFNPYRKDVHETYLASGDWHDKAGAYGLQSGAAPLVSRIVGEYDSVLGLPTKALADMLRRFGVTGSAVALDAPVPIKQLP